MGRKVEYDEERSIRVFQGDSEVINGSTINSIRDLTVILEPLTFHMVIELDDGADFVDGSCNGKRTNENRANFIVSSSGIERGKVRIVGAWGEAVFDGVKITQPFELFIDGNNDL